MANLERVKDVYVLGSTTRDEITRIQSRFSNHINSGQTSGINFTTAIDSEYCYLGGTGINIACNLRQFCNKNIYLFSVIGQDNGDTFQLLNEHNINSDFVDVREGF